MDETPAKFPFGPKSTQGDIDFNNADDAYEYLMKKVLERERNGEVGIQPSREIQLLTDIWHNQATIIKWLSKIAENTKSK